MKKIISLTVVLIMLFSVVIGQSVSAFALDADRYSNFNEDFDDDFDFDFDEDFEIFTSGDFEYILLDDGTAAIVGYYGEDEELVIPDELDGYVVTVIDDMAFLWCDSLVRVVIGGNITYIGMLVFGGCEYLSEIDVDDSNAVYSSIDGVLFNKDKTELVLYPVGSEREVYTVPDGVLSIAENAFVTSLYLTSVILPESVEYIGNWAFAFCMSMESIYIMNADCFIDEDEWTIYEETTIYGYNDSTAHEYALANGRNFVALDAEVDDPTTDEPKDEPKDEPTTEAPEDGPKDEPTTKAPEKEPTTEPTTGATEKPSAADKNDTVKSPSTGAAGKGILAFAAIALAGGAVMLTKKKEQDQ